MLQLLLAQLCPGFRPPLVRRPIVGHVHAHVLDALQVVQHKLATHLLLVDPLLLIAQLHLFPQQLHNAKLSVVHCGVHLTPPPFPYSTGMPISAVAALCLEKTGQIYSGGGDDN